jgi:hypothetical protein
MFEKKLNRKMIFIKREMKRNMFLIILSAVLLFGPYSVHAKVYTEEDLELYENDSNTHQPTSDSQENNKIPEDNKSKRKNTKTHFSARGCEVVKFSPYNQTVSSKIRKKERIVQGSRVVDLGENVIAHTKTTRCSSFTIRNTSYSHKVSPIIKATSEKGKTYRKRIRIPKLDQNKTYSDKVCFEDSKDPIVKLECSF